MNYVRRVYLHFRLTNKSDQKAYIPINCRYDSAYNSRICILLNDRRLTDVYMAYGGGVSDSFYNNTLLPNKSIGMRITLNEFHFKDVGFSEFARSQKIVQQLNLVYDKSQSDTSLVHLPIADIEFKLAKDVIYEYRDTIHPEADLFWIL